MPIYEYRCSNGHVFDVIQKMTDEPLSACQECGAPASRVLTPPAIHFKGSGFHNTDYGKRKSTANGGSGSEASKESSATSSKESSGSSGGSKPGGSKAPASAAGD